MVEHSHPVPGLVKGPGRCCADAPVAPRNQHAPGGGPHRRRFRKGRAGAQGALGGRRGGLFPCGGQGPGGCAGVLPRCGGYRLGLFLHPGGLSRPAGLDGLQGQFRGFFGLGGPGGRVQLKGQLKIIFAHGLYLLQDVSRCLVTLPPAAAPPVPSLPESPALRHFWTKKRAFSAKYHRILYTIPAKKGRVPRKIFFPAFRCGTAGSIWAFSPAGPGAG